MKLTVVLFNLGAPASPDDVRPFLFNLFNDPAILGLPSFVRKLLAHFLATRRAKFARPIYDRLGGGSPLLPNTLAQAAALKDALSDLGSVDVVPAMRYWHPMSDEVAVRVKTLNPDKIVLLPLYPQFSTTTTASSRRAWTESASRAGITAPTRAVCCYPIESGFVSAIATLIRPVYDRLRLAAPAMPPRILFTAHGLPKKVVERGDPYQTQVEMTAAAVVAALEIPGLDWQLCYQSRVGPLEWIGPYAEQEIARAGAEKVPLVVVPIAFVSEHSETLVELDITYRDEAKAKGVPLYERVPTVDTHPEFIAGLARLVRAAIDQRPDIAPDGGARLCPSAATRCALSRGTEA